MGVGGSLVEWSPQPVRGEAASSRQCQTRTELEDAQLAAELMACWRRTHTHLVTEALCADCGVRTEENCLHSRAHPRTNDWVMTTIPGSRGLDELPLREGSLLI